MMDEREQIAAERALGTEPVAGESLADALLREAWSLRLAPLMDAVPAETPPTDLFSRIEAEIGAAGGMTAVVSDATAPAGAANTNTGPAETNVVDLDQMRQRLRRWKGVAGTAVAIAAALAIYVAVPQVIDQPAAPAAKYVAVVSADEGGQAGLIIQIDTGTGVATVIPVGITPPEGKSYEMWQLPQGATRPVSLGLMPQNAVARSTIEANPGDLFAISLEPAGGSPTGQPTLPQFHGRVVKVE